MTLPDDTPDRATTIANTHNHQSFAARDACPSCAAAMAAAKARGATTDPDRATIAALREALTAFVTAADVLGYAHDAAHYAALLRDTEAAARLHDERVGRAAVAAFLADPRLLPLLDEFFRERVGRLDRYGMTESILRALADHAAGTPAE